MPTLFSILVPVYNVEKYIHQCVDSVLSQTYPNFELILVDDGSTDASGSLCDEYSAKDSRITVIHQPNQGLIMARRTGIGAAKGNYFLFLDSDDYWDINVLETINNTIDEFGCDMILFKFRRVSETGKFISEGIAQFEDKTIFTPENKERLLQRIISGPLNNLVTKAVNRDIVDFTDYTEYKHIKSGEDLLQSMPLICNAQRIVYLDRALYNYRYNTLSITNSFNVQRYKDSTQVRTVLLGYLKKLGYDSEQNLKISYCAYLRVMLSYEYDLMNASLPYGQKLLVLNDIHLLPIYQQSIQYYMDQFFTLTERIRFKLSLKRHYRLLFWLCKIMRIRTIFMQQKKRRQGIASSAV